MNQIHQTWIFGFVAQISLSYNIDTKFPIIFKNNERDSYFGFSVEFYRNQSQHWALISAPKANSSSSYHTGTLYQCRISTRECQEIRLTYPRTGKDNMMVGISLDVHPTNGGIVTCGHLWKRKVQRTFFPNGLCYFIDYNKRPNQQKVIPLGDEKENNDQTRKINGSDYTINNYAYGIAGFSARFTEDGKDVVLGAPGVLEGAGSIIKYPWKKKWSSFWNILDPDPEKSEDFSYDSYIGYSVSSGHFFDNKSTLLVAGAPRAGYNRGYVYIFENVGRKKDNFKIYFKIKGSMIGEYFGASVLGVNINNDQYTDLLIGAPFHSTLRGGDEGRVYTYLSDGKKLQFQSKILEGSNIPNARFGMSIVRCGDLNKDGFFDIAIGAPYEDEKGVVYIYHGSESGVKQDYVQVKF